MLTTRIVEMLEVTEAAALAAGRWMGKGDKHAADDAAVEGMRTAFNDVDIAGTIVIGEGERDEAPMLYIGEKVGAGGEEIDIAVDPLEGTNLTAYGQSNSLAVLAFGPKGTLLHAPDTYMNKIAVGPEAADGGPHRRHANRERPQRRQGPQARRRGHRRLHPRPRPARRPHPRGPRRRARASGSSPTATCSARSPRRSRAPASTCTSASAPRPRACSRARR